MRDHFREMHRHTCQVAVAAGYSRAGFLSRQRRLAHLTAGHAVVRVVDDDRRKPFVAVCSARAFTDADTIGIAVA